MTKNKFFVILTTIILLSIIILTVIPSNHSPQNTPASQTQVVMGKVSSTGILFLVEQQNPLASGYSPVQTNEIIHGGHFEIYIYNPNKNTSIPITIEEYSIGANNSVQNLSFQNVTEISGQHQINSFKMNIHLTNNQEYLLIGIGGTFYQLQEKYVPVAPMPFYDQGEIAYLLFIMIMSGITIFLAFGIALIMLRKAKYFPPIPTLYLIVGAGIFSAMAEPILTTNYYQIIQAQWSEYFIPLFVLSLLIFLSKIPASVQKGLLLRFMGDRGNGEVRTQFLTILTSEIELLEINGLRHSGMEHINRRSYLDFFKRLFGFHIPIYFLEGELPAPVEQPERIGISSKKIKFHLKNAFKFKNLKKDRGDFDFGYLLDQSANPQIIKIPKSDINSEVETGLMSEPGEQKKSMAEKIRTLRKSRILKIPISGHHSKAIEEFLAGLNEAELKGKRIDEITLENAQLKAEIKAKTYFSTTEIIEQMSRIMTGEEKEEGVDDRNDISSTD